MRFLPTALWIRHRLLPARRPAPKSSPSAPGADVSGLRPEQETRHAECERGAAGGDAIGRRRPQRFPGVAAVEAAQRAADAEADGAVDRLAAVLMPAGEKAIHHLHAGGMKTAKGGGGARL